MSAAYLAAVDFTIGLMICSSPCSQSEVNFHSLPSQVWMRAQDAPMWSAQEVLIGRITPAKPSASSLACVRSRFSRPQRTCSPVMTLPLPKRSCAARMPSTPSIALMAPRM